MSTVHEKSNTFWSTEMLNFSLRPGSLIRMFSDSYLGCPNIETTILFDSLNI
jgi:hypothetical protein